MERFTNKQRVHIVKNYYQNCESGAETVRRLCVVFGRNEAPNKCTVLRLIKKIETTGSVATVKSPGRNRTQRIAQQIAVVQQRVTVSPVKSIHRRSQQLSIPRSSLQRILSKDLHMHAYEIQLVQQLQTADHQKRRRFCEWIEERLAVDEHFVKNIIFSDEAHFHLSGFVNKQNCRIWGNENPRVTHEHQMHPQKTIMWCGFWSGGVIGPFFFENDEGDSATVNGERYRRMLTSFLWPFLRNIDI